MTVGHTREKRTLYYPSTEFNPEDWLRFVQFHAFLTGWQELRLGDDDLRALEMLIMLAPKRAPVVKGTGGLRKIRFAPKAWNAGKSGACRIGYVYFEAHAIVLLLIAYSKDVQDDLSPKEKKAIATLIADVERRLAKRGG